MSGIAKIIGGIFIACFAVMGWRYANNNYDGGIVPIGQTAATVASQDVQDVETSSSVDTEGDIGDISDSQLNQSVATIDVQLAGLSDDTASTSNSLAVHKSKLPNTVTRLTSVIANAHSEIDTRIAVLNALNMRIQAMQNASQTDKTNIASEVHTNSAGLTALQKTIDADTDLTQARTDAQTIFNTFQIYALVIPRGWILASADRVVTLSNLISTLADKIEARISAEQTAGEDVSKINTVLADMNAKTDDAHAHATVAQSTVTALMSDQGDTAIAAANRAALIAAQMNIKTATADLQGARTDIKTLLAVISASSSLSTATTTQINGMVGKTK